MSTSDIAPGQGGASLLDMRGEYASWLFLAAHGGAGAATLTRYSRQLGRTYAAHYSPQLPEHLPIVLVCRDHIAGLWSAQQIAATHDLAPRLIGLVVVAESPGKAPRPVTGTVQLLRGAVPQLWQVPYIAPLRLVHPAARTDCTWPPLHPDLAQVFDDIRATAARSNPATEEGRWPR